MLVRVGVLIVHLLFLWVTQADRFDAILTLPMALLCMIALGRIHSRWLTAPDIIWLTAWLFFVVAPIQGMERGVYISGPVRYIAFTEQQWAASMAIPVLFFAAVLMTSIVAQKSLGRPRRISITSIPDMKAWILPFLVYFATVVTTAMYGGPGRVLMSRRERYDLGDPSSLINVGLAFTFGFAYLFFARLMRGWIADPKTIGLGVLVAAPLLFLQNPWNTPRYYLICLYTPIILIFLKGRLKVSLAYGAIAFLLIVAMPLLSATTRSGSLEAAFAGGNGLDASQVQFIDGYEELTFAVRKVADREWTFGRRTIGAVLFFVPRSVWKSKPQLLGVEVGEDLLFFDRGGTSNLSMFLGAELYSDAGYIGVIAGAVTLTLIFMYLGMRRMNYIEGVDLRHAILLANIPILVRGPIGANIGLFVCQMIALSIAVRFIGKTRRAKVSNSGEKIGFGKSSSSDIVGGHARA